MGSKGCQHVPLLTNASVPCSDSLRPLIPPTPTARSEAGLRLLGRLPLRSLILSACCQLTDGCLAAISQGMPQLRCLGLFEAGGCMHLLAALLCLAVPTVDLAHSTQPRLSTAAGEEVTDEGLSHLARLKGGLTALDLGYSCWSHSAAGLAALLGQMSQLRMLNIGALLFVCLHGSLCPGGRLGHVKSTVQLPPCRRSLPTVGRAVSTTTALPRL